MLAPEFFTAPARNAPLEGQQRCLRDEHQRQEQLHGQLEDAGLGRAPEILHHDDVGPTVEEHPDYVQVDLDAVAHEPLNRGEPPFHSALRMAQEHPYPRAGDDGLSEEKPRKKTVNAEAKEPDSDDD